MFAFRAAIPEDLPRATALSARIGWNQVAADWAFFLDHGAIRVLEDADPDCLAASAALLPHGDRLAWISMVLVRPDQRRRGLASALLRWAMDARPGVTLALDATPAGRLVYAPMGFQEIFGFTRWLLPGPLPPVRGSLVRPMVAADWPAVLAQDAATFGAPRADLLRRFAARAPAFVAPGGFVLARDGLRTPQIGPLVAPDAATAAALLAAAQSALGVPAVLDLKDSAMELAQRLAEAGATPQRPFTRMAIGPMPALQCHENFVLAGPEFG
ncbi:GNAT family N-acetyltransferase [Falsiroseomonas selenitidurans]|uniref:GNAT family N-acetyltransferase n=1 Tax=Falsiroseomonas selenitidurans TaxID=2716335 RepID=A0ABX1E7M2_9PROT|nr:GNAT family N-acetyltransferase [Falsiroseomonas selenitidurans]NKC32730.1 GNAT family N-acetyltransferase [Falsiroseomonas selenitidurans]